MKFLRKTIVVLFSILTLTVFASAASFADVPKDSPWYDGVQYVTENNMSNGISKTSFGADTTISTTQWAAFLLRAFPANDGGLANLTYPDDYVAECVKHDYLSENAIESPYAPITRETLFSSLFSAAGIQLYNNELYENGQPMRASENAFRVAKDNGMCADSAGKYEYVTRGEAAHAIYWIKTHEIYQELPPIVLTFPLCTPEGHDVTAVYSELNDIPQPIRDSFLENGWAFHVDSGYLADYSVKNHINAVGLTSENEKCVYVAGTGSARHEMGHYLQDMLDDDNAFEKLYLEEKANAALLFREYAMTSSHEYFADYFAAWVNRNTSQSRLEKMRQLTPKTYAYFESLESNNWGLWGVHMRK